MVEETHQEPLITMHCEYKKAVSGLGDYPHFTIIGKGKYKSLYDKYNEGEVAFENSSKIELKEYAKFEIPVAKPLRFYDFNLWQEHLNEIYKHVIETLDLPLWKAIDIFVEKWSKGEKLSEEPHQLEEGEEGYEEGTQSITNVMGFYIKLWVDVLLVIRFAEETGYMFVLDFFMKPYGDRKKLIQFYKWCANQKKAIYGSNRRNNLFISSFATHRLVNKKNPSKSMVNMELPIAEQHAKISAWILEDIHIQDLDDKTNYDTYVKWASMFAKTTLLIGHGHYEYDPYDNIFYNTKTKEKLKTKRELLLKTFKECFPEVNDKDLRRYALEHGKRGGEILSKGRGRADKRTDM